MNNQNKSRTVKPDWTPLELSNNSSGEKIWHIKPNLILTTAFAICVWNGISLNHFTELFSMDEHAEAGRAS